MIPVCVAFKAHLGWVNTVAVRIDSDSPRPVRAERLELFEGEDRDLREPYHIAGGWDGLERVPRPENPAAVIRRALQRQARSTKSRLSAFAESLLAEELQWSRAVVLTGRGWLGDLEHILGSHAHIHVAEGEAVRSATRAALDALNIARVDQDEKSTLSESERILDCEDCDRLLKDLRPAAVKSWTKEERLIALAAWLHRC